MIAMDKTFISFMLVHRSQNTITSRNSVQPVESFDISVSVTMGK